MRRLMTLMAMAGLLVGVLAVPAVADPPVEFEDSLVRDEVDPCTGDTMSVTYIWTVRQHDHVNNFVEIVDSYFETSTGYLATGHENIVRNKNKFIQVFNWIAVNENTGARFSVMGRLVIDLDSGEPNVTVIKAKCIGDNDA